MCTVTWLRRPGGYAVYFNRDEKRDRPAARPPARSERDGMPYLAPLDGRAGGTWLAVNARGLAVGLLNHDPAVLQAEREQPPVSRGLLVLDMMAEADPAGVDRRMADADLDAYRPFLLMAWAPDDLVRLHRWDGRQLLSTTLRDDAQPVSTSSHRPADVVPARVAAFRQFIGAQPDPDEHLLAAYHQSRDERDDAFSVFMSRPDAETVSFSRVTVGPGSISFYYAPRSPGSPEFPRGSLYTLDRA